MTQRRLVSVLLAAMFGATTLAACGESRVDSSAIPTTAPSGGKTVCGALPQRAVELALGTPDFRVEQPNAGLDEMRSATTAACFVYATTGNKKLVLDVGFSGVMQSDNQILLEQLKAGESKTSTALPADLGTGLVTHPWSRKAPSAQVTMIDGPDRLQITLHRGPKERDQGKDVLAIARLLKPSFP